MAEELIRAGRILIDGKTVALGRRVLGTEAITIDGKPLPKKSAEKVVFAFYKPVGVECTMRQFEAGDKKTLADFDFGSTRVFPVGRLDRDSEGLLLMTNDGQLANELTHPRYEHEKEYVVTVDKPLTDTIIQQLASGKIEIEDKPVQPAMVTRKSAEKFQIVLKEGRKRQIRLMCVACGLRVLNLKRIRIQEIELGKLSLIPGQFKEINFQKK